MILKISNFYLGPGIMSGFYPEKISYGLKYLLGRLFYKKENHKKLVI